ncbi:MAG: arginine decarboxylase, pyruvoyl-dependent [Candidatus Dadabacteria bacterium]|nr:arginine decarboxylase, pyruvoyl-dependent [Candidatus Dadabacteria bacterium]
MENLYLVPKQAFLTKGVGKHKHKLTSFEMALRNAMIAEYNLVRVSSIFPPECKLISKSAGLKQMNPGQVAFCVMSDNSTNEPNRLIASSVGIAIPRDRSRYGYLSEHHSFGQTDAVAGEYAEDLAADMLATILDAPFDPDKSYDEKKDIWKISGHIVKTRNITQSAVGDKNGLWTTVVAALVFTM